MSEPVQMVVDGITKKIPVVDFFTASERDLFRKFCRHLLAGSDKFKAYYRNHFIDRIVDDNESEICKETILMKIVSKGAVRAFEIIDYLIDKHDMDLKDIHGRNLVLIACHLSVGTGLVHHEQDKLDILTRVLSLANKDQINQVDDNGHNALLLCYGDDSSLCYQLLLKRGADPFIFKQRPIDIVKVALDSRAVGCAQVLLEHFRENGIRIPNSDFEWLIGYYHERTEIRIAAILADHKALYDAIVPQDDTKKQKSATTEQPGPSVTATAPPVTKKVKGSEEKNDTEVNTKKTMFYCWDCEQMTSNKEGQVCMGCFLDKVEWQESH